MSDESYDIDNSASYDSQEEWDRINIRDCDDTFIEEDEDDDTVMIDCSKFDDYKGQKRQREWEDEDYKEVKKKKFEPQECNHDDFTITPPVPEMEAQEHQFREESFKVKPIVLDRTTSFSTKYSLFPEWTTRICNSGSITASKKDSGDDEQDSSTVIGPIKQYNPKKWKPYPQWTIKNGKRIK